MMCGEYGQGLNHWLHRIPCLPLCFPIKTSHRPLPASPSKNAPSRALRQNGTPHIFPCSPLPPQVRTFYVAGLAGGLRNDTHDEMLERRQRWRLADVRLEEYCFVVLSRVINAIEEQV